MACSSQTRWQPLTSSWPTASFQDSFSLSAISDLYSLLYCCPDMKISLFDIFFSLLKSWPETFFLFCIVFAIFPLATHHWVPIGALTCLKVLWPSPWFSPLGQVPFLWPSSPDPEAILHRVSWCHWRQLRFGCPNPSDTLEERSCPDSASSLLSVLEETEAQSRGQTCPQLHSWELATG